MQKNIVLFAALILGAATVLGQAPDISRMDVVERSVPAGPVALVDGVAIEGQEFLRDYRRHLINVMQMVGDPELDDEFRVHAGLTILGEMIRNEILLKEAGRRNLSVTDSELHAEYNQKLEHFSRLLEAETGAKPTEAQILEKAGQTREQALESVRSQLLVEKISEILVKDKGGSVSTADARTYYEKNPQLFQTAGGIHLHQILLLPKPSPAKADESSWKKTEEQMDRVRARILAGEQFAAVARDVSEAPDASKGGDMGMLMASELPPFFVEMARQMKPGDISGVFRSQYGVHLIRLIDTEPAEIVSFDEAEERIKRVLMRVKMEEAVLQFCEPIVNDGNRTKIFIQLERTLGARGVDSNS